LFAIVRNTWYSRVARRPVVDDAVLDDADRNEPRDGTPDPEERLRQRDTVTRVRAALERLPVDFREVLVLRELEGLSYKEIVEVVQVPLDTVMSS
jgi:RNA polymerase sigma-70 factor (ECF subfamily)